MIKTRLIRLLSDSRKYIVWQVIWQWISLLAQVAAIRQTALLAGAALDKTLTGGMTARAAAIVAAAILVRFLCDRMNVKASFQASLHVKRILREQIYGKLLRLGASYREKVSTAEVVQMSVEGVEQLETYFGRYLSQLFYSLLAPLTLFIILMRVSLRASVVLLICVPLIPMSIVVVQKIAKRLLSKYWGAYTELGDSFLENLQGLTTLRIYQADQMKAEEMDRESEHFRKITMKVLTMQLNSTSVMDIMAYGGAAVGMVVVIRQFLAGTVSFSGALMICLLAAEFFIPLRILGSFFHIAMNGMAASDRIFAFLDLEEPESGTAQLVDDDRTVRFTDVSFRYTEDRAVLADVDLEAAPGRLVSVVGASGSGKSTIAGILTGRNKDYTGSVRIGAQEVREIEEASLMRHVTMVTSDSYLFKGTIRDNLLAGNPAATDEMLFNVLRQVNLETFVRAHEGLDTLLTERAGNLSGGQRQRLAIARALLHDSPVYIFDEATSNIDAESEAMIMQVVRRLARERTVILISHRLANVVDSDQIYVIEDGTISETGTHDELMLSGGLYSRLFLQQKELEHFGRADAEKRDL
ncbi:MAG: ABC transporter ATP-binding protein/permease [Eubacterium sp.]|nr:ABC transporter ATP-binding protein/permease [Eubacterium sp.]